MKYRDFGRTGMKVSVLGMGCWQAGMQSWGNDYSTDDIHEAIKTSSQAGVNFFDTAEIYGKGVSERTLATALKDDNIYIATKVAGFNGGNAEKSAKLSYERLGRPIDLYQLHWVPSYYTGIKKAIRSLENCVRSGWVRHIGVSNFPLAELQIAIESTEKEDVVSDQLEFSIADRRLENGLMEFTRKNGVEIIAYSPLGRGMLTGKYRQTSPPKDFARRFYSGKRKYLQTELLDAIHTIAEKHSCGDAEVSLAWVISKGALPIPGAKNRTQAEGNARSSEVSLKKEEIDTIDRLSLGFKEGTYRNIVPRVVPDVLVKSFTSLGI